MDGAAERFKYLHIDGFGSHRAERDLPAQAFEELLLAVIQLAEQFAETAETQPELLAYHHTEAGLIAQALPYWQQAGERATQRSAYVEAMAHLTKGLELLKTLGRLYVQHTEANPTYQVVAGAVGLLVFLNVVNQLVLFAAALTATSHAGQASDLADRATRTAGDPRSPSPQLPPSRPSSGSQDGHWPTVDPGQPAIRSGVPGPPVDPARDPAGGGAAGDG